MKSLLWKLFLALAFLATVGVLSVAALLFYQSAFVGKIYPGVKVLGVDVGGLTLTEAESLLRQEFANYKGHSVVISYGNRRWELSSGEVGAVVDYRATALTAYLTGRQGSLWQQVRQQAVALVRGVELLPVVRFDWGKAYAFLSRIAREVNRPVQDGGLSITPDLSVVEVPPQDGVEVDIEATLKQVERLIASMQSGEVGLVVRTLPAAVASTEEAARQTRSLLNTELTLRFGERAWAVEPATIASWLDFVYETGADGRSSLVVKLDDEAIRSFLQRIAAQIDREPRDARFDFDPQTGTLTPILYSQKGYRLLVDRAVEAVKEALMAGQSRLELPVEVIEPAVSVEKASQLGITTLVSKGTTRFKGSSASRVKNIKLAAARFNGVVIPPGGVFSFNHYLGSVTAADGYEDSLIIFGDSTRVGIGGGICQVSSTAFRAAFWGGYEILERHAHGYRVRWYEPPVGMDATVYSPYVDLKFRNDTPYYLLIETEVDEEAGTLTFYFYSSPTGRTVEMEGPFIKSRTPHGPPVYKEDPTLPEGTVKQVEWAVDGLEVEVRRIVRENGQVIRRDVFVSRYRPWRAVYLVGTGGS